MDIRLSRPCVEDPARFIAECNLGKKLVMDKLCNLLREKMVNNLKCSLSLGVARFELENKNVIIYRSGRVDIRRIQNIEEARVFLEKISLIVKEAISDISS